MFDKWGLPLNIRVDNGSPFGSPQLASVAPFALWLIGLAIQVLWNRPRSPKENAKVERNQGTTSKWVEIDKCRSIEECQLKLDDACLIQREKYPVNRLKFKKRSEVYPDLFMNPRKYSSQSFNEENVYAFLEQTIFVRKIHQRIGKFTFYDQSVYLGYRFRKLRFVIVKLDRQNFCWNVYNEHQELIATVPAENFSAENIQNFTVRQRTNAKAKIIKT